MLKVDAMINNKHSSGFSLIELMVAMQVGLIIVSGAFSLHQSTRQTQVKNEEQMDMVADARFAIEMIAYDLRHTGMWGGTNKDSLITCTSADTSCPTVPAPASNECASGVAPAWAYNLSVPIFATDNNNPYSSTCIGASEGYVPNTDVLELRYADSNEATLRSNQPYVRSNFIDGRVFVGTAAPALDSYETSPLTMNHELHAYAYYVSNYTDAVGDGLPSLRRVSLVMGPTLQNQTLISGVTDLQVQFGIDRDDDTIIDGYVDPSDIATDDWEHVYAAKIWLLMRSDTIQAGIDTTKPYTMAGVTTSYGADGYRYFMVTSVVNLRNRRKI